MRTSQLIQENALKVNEVPNHVVRKSFFPTRIVAAQFILFFNAGLVASFVQFMIHLMTKARAGSNGSNNILVEPLRSREHGVTAPLNEYEYTHKNVVCQR